MKIGVVGTFVRDRIIFLQGQKSQSIGGLFFTVSYLANLLGPEDEVMPVCFVGEDFYEIVVEQLSQYSNVSIGGLTRLPRKNTMVQLTYTGMQERDEVTTEPMPPLTIEQLSLVGEADAVIVNLVTGTDVELADLRALREMSEATLYLDFHSRALAISKAGKRFYRYPPDWQEWVNLVDILQMNEMEAATLSGCHDGLSEAKLADFCRELVATGPSICHVTLGEKGSALVCRAQGSIKVRRFPAIEVPVVKDVIGCGDSFQAAFVSKYLSGSDVVTATEFAHKIASANCTFAGSTGIAEIKTLVAKIDS